MRTSLALAQVFALALSAGGCSKLLGISDPGPGEHPMEDGGPIPIDTGMDGPPPCIAPPAYAAPLSFDLPGKPESMVVGDFDADGKQDVAIAVTSNSVILHGDGTGNLGRLQMLNTVGTRIVKASLDAINGGNDLLLWRVGGPNISVRVHNPNIKGSFFIDTFVLVASEFSSLGQVTAAALDGNEATDLVIQDSVERRVFTSNQGNIGSFAAEGTVGDGGDQLVSLSSLRGGLTDRVSTVAVLVAPGGDVKMATHTNGKFDPAVMVATGATGTAVALGNFDTDTHRDLILATPQGGVIYTQTSTSGAPAFSKRSGTVPGVTGAVLQVADVDGNGRDDLLVADGILQQCEPGTFSSLVPISLAPSTVVADLNNNGKPDLLRIAGATLEVRVQ